MKRLLRSYCKSTFVALLVVALSNVAMAQRDHKDNHGTHNKMDKAVYQNSAASEHDMVPYVPSGSAMTLPDYQGNLYEALKAQGVPSTMNANKLTADWHIISSGAYGIFALISPGQMPLQILSFTQGKIISFGTQQYLVAYHSQASADDSPDRYSSQRTHDNGYILKDTSLSLSLLPLAGEQAIYEIKKFDPEKDFISKPKVMRQSSLSNLKQVALGVMMYTQDYDEKFPPMIAARNADEMMHPVSHGNASVDTVQNRLMPYVKNEKLFLQPVTGRPYLPNYKLSRHSLASVNNPTTTILFYEDAPDADGMRNVAYADGHAKAVTEAEFQRERKAQGISESGYPSAAKATKKAKAKPKA